MAMPEGIDNVMFLIVMRKHNLQRGYDVPQSPDIGIEALVSTIAQVWVRIQNPYPPGLIRMKHHILGAQFGLIPIIICLEYLGVSAGDNTSIGIPQLNSWDHDIPWLLAPDPLNISRDQVTLSTFWRSAVKFRSTSQWEQKLSLELAGRGCWMDICMIGESVNTIFIS